MNSGFWNLKSDFNIISLTMFQRKYSNFTIISHTILTKILVQTQKCGLLSGVAYNREIAVVPPLKMVKNLHKDLF